MNLLEIPVGPAAHPAYPRLEPWRGTSVRRGGGDGILRGVMTSKPPPSVWLAEAPGPRVPSCPPCPLCWGHGRRHRRAPPRAPAPSITRAGASKYFPGSLRLQEPRRQNQRIRSLFLSSFRPRSRPVVSSPRCSPSGEPERRRSGNVTWGCLTKDWACPGCWLSRCRQGSLSESGRGLGPGSPAHVPPPRLFRTGS